MLAATIISKAKRDVMINNNQKEKEQKGAPLVRGSAAPRPTNLGRSEEPLYRFFDRLGKVIYGTDWRASPTLHIAGFSDDIHPIGSQDEKIETVYKSIISGLGSGKIGAFVELTVIVNGDIRAIARTDDLAPDDEDLVYDDGNPKLRKFSLQKSLWEKHHPDVRIHSATVAIDPNFLIERNAKAKRIRSAIEAYGTSLAKTAEIFVERPDQILDMIVKECDIPQNTINERFVVYKSKCRIEALAVGWRYIALYGANSDIKNANLARHMLEYMNKHDSTLGDDPSPHRLKACERMASNMLRQRSEMASSVSVLVSAAERERG